MGIKLATTLLGIGKIGGGLLAGQKAEEQAEENSKIDLQDAEIKLEEGRRRALARRKAGVQGAKTARAATAASGITQSGTALASQIEALATGELNALEESRISLTEATKLRQSSRLNIKRGKVAKNTSLLNAASTGVSTFSKIRNLT